MAPWAGVVASHAAGLAIMFGLMRYTGENPRIFIYGFFFAALYRLATVPVMLNLNDSDGAGRTIARGLSRAPHPDRVPQSLKVATFSGYRSGGLGAYLALMVFFGGATFVMVNLQGRLMTPMDVMKDELLRGLLAGLLWWVMDLVDRRITLRFDRSAEDNYGYNAGDSGTIALNTFVGGMMSLFQGSPWPYFYALIVLKTFDDVGHEIKYPCTEHPRDERMMGD